jgi:uncharacterized protein YkwD
MTRTNIGRLGTRFVPLLGAVAVVIGILIPAQSASASTATSNAAPTADTSGYAWVNYFRALAGLGGVNRNLTMEAQEAVHIRYLANRGLACESNVHDELTSRLSACGANRYATGGGKAAANNSNITRSSAMITDRSAISSWFTAAFHALTLLDPRLVSTGYAAYYTPSPTGAKPMAWNYTAGVDVYRGRSGKYNGLAVTFPANNAVSPLLSYSVGTESPEPFRATTTASACHSWGSKQVVSAPIIVQRAKLAAQPTGAASIVDLTTGRSQPTCSLAASSYAAGSLPYVFLNGANGITRTRLYYAASPYIAGHRYQLRIGSGAVTTFTAGAMPAAPRITASGTLRGMRASWTTPIIAGSGQITKYWASWHLGSGCTGARVGSATVTQRSLAIGRLTSGRYYSVRVLAINSLGGSRWSNCTLVRAV